MPLKYIKSFLKARDRQVRLGLLVLLVGAFVWFLLYMAGESFRQIIIERISNSVGARVELKSSRLSLSGQLVLEKLVIAPKSKEFDDAVFQAKKIVLKIDRSDLLGLKVNVQKVTVKDFVFNAQHNNNTDQWNLSRLKFALSKKGSKSLPEIELKRGLIKQSGITNGKPDGESTLYLNAEFKPAGDQPNKYLFNVETSNTPRTAKNILTGLWQRGRTGTLTLTGKITPFKLDLLEKDWLISNLSLDVGYDKDSFEIKKLATNDLQFFTKNLNNTNAVSSGSKKDPKIIEVLRWFLQTYNPQGRFDFQAQYKTTLGDSPQKKYNGKITCKDISIKYIKFPYLMENLHGVVYFSDQGIKLDKLSARHNDVELELDGLIEGLDSNAKARLSVKSSNMQLDDDLYQALGTKQKKAWNSVAPVGIAAIDYQYTRTPELGNKGTLSLDLIDVEAAHRLFPYPLKKLTGNLFFDKESITLDNLISAYDGRMITIDGRAWDTNTKNPSYDIDIAAKRLPLDATLGAALADSQRKFYDSLNISGHANATVKVIDRKNKKNITANVAIRDASMQYRGFDINDCVIDFTYSPGIMEITNYRGRQSESLIQLDGKFWADEGKELNNYQMSIRSDNFELTKDLASIFQESVGNAYSKLRPEGKVEFIANLNKTNDAKADYEIIVNCLGNSVDFDRINYPLRDVRGKIIIDSNSIELKDITAKNARTVKIPAEESFIKIDGKISLGEKRTGRFKISANDILFENRFGDGLGDAAKAFYDKLKPTGSVDAEFGNIKIFSDDSNSTFISFNGQMDLRDCSFTAEPNIVGLRAKLNIDGLYKIGQGLNTCQADVLADSLVVSNKELTQLDTTISYVPESKGWLGSNMVANCYGGTVCGRFGLTKLPELQTTLELYFKDIDVKQFSKIGKDTKNAFRDTAGQMCGTLNISKQGDASKRLGICQLNITNMKVGKKSLMAKLFDIFGKKNKSEFFFDRMIVDSYIKGDEVWFNQFDMHGTSLDLMGKGDLSFGTKQIDVVFAAKGKRVSQLPLIQPLANTIGPLIMRIEVQGDYRDPVVKTNPLPAISDALEIFGGKK